MYFKFVCSNWNLPEHVQYVRYNEMTLLCCWYCRPELTMCNLVFVCSTYLTVFCIFFCRIFCVCMWSSCLLYFCCWCCWCCWCFYSCCCRVPGFEPEIRWPQTGVLPPPPSAPPSDLPPLGTICATPGPPWPNFTMRKSSVFELKQID